MNQFWLFENINLFTLLCPHKWQQYQNQHAFKCYNRSEYIYVEGDLSSNFFLISKGRVKIGFWDDTEGEIVTAYLGKGEIFGESVVLDHHTRKEFAQAVENDTELCPVTLSQTEELMRNNKNFSIGLYKFIGYKFKKLERSYRIMLFRDTRTRLIEFIKDMIEDNKGNSYKMVIGGCIISNPYSQGELAKLIGTSRSTLNILLCNLQQEGFLEWEKGKIVIKNKFLLEF